MASKLEDVKVSPDIAKSTMYKSVCIPYKDKYALLYIVKGDRLRNRLCENIELLDKPIDIGVYCWILYTNKDDKLVFKCVQVRDRFELFTQHSNIVCKEFDSIKHINLAGELYLSNKETKKNKKIIYFNFQSGTFMKNLIDSRQIDEDSITESFKKYFYKNVDNNIKLKYNYNTLIEDNLVPLTEGEIEKYRKLGINVMVVDDIGSCMETYQRRDDILNWITSGKPGRPPKFGRSIKKRRPTKKRSKKIRGTK